MKNNLPKPPEHLESLLAQLKDYPVLVVRPANNKKFHIVQILRMIPSQVMKTIIKGLDKKTAEETVIYHNQQINEK